MEMATKLHGLYGALWRLADQTESAEAKLYADTLFEIAAHGFAEDLIHFYNTLIDYDERSEITLRTLISLKAILSCEERAA